LREFFRGDQQSKDVEGRGGSFGGDNRGDSDDRGGDRDDRDDYEDAVADALGAGLDLNEALDYADSMDFSGSDPGDADIEIAVSGPEDTGRDERGGDSDREADQQRELENAVSAFFKQAEDEGRTLTNAEIDEAMREAEAAGVDRAALEKAVADVTDLSVEDVVAERKKIAENKSIKEAIDLNISRDPSEPSVVEQVDTDLLSNG